MRENGQTSLKTVEWKREYYWENKWKFIGAIGLTAASIVSVVLPIASASKKDSSEIELDIASAFVSAGVAAFGLVPLFYAIKDSVLLEKQKLEDQNYVDAQHERTRKHITELEKKLQDQANSNLDEVKGEFARQTDEQKAALDSRTSEFRSTQDNHHNDLVSRIKKIEMQGYYQQMSGDLKELEDICYTRTEDNVALRMGNLIEKIKSEERRYLTEQCRSKTKDEQAGEQVKVYLAAACLYDSKLLQKEKMKSLKEKAISGRASPQTPISKQSHRSASSEDFLEPLEEGLSIINSYIEKHSNDDPGVMMLPYRIRAAILVEKARVKRDCRDKVQLNDAEKNDIALLASEGIDDLNRRVLSHDGIHPSLPVCLTLGRAYHVLSKVVDDVKKVEEENNAEKWFNEAAKMRANVFASLSDLYIQQGQYEKAKRYIESSRGWGRDEDIERRDPILMCNYAETLLGLGKEQEAAIYIQQSLSSLPSENEGEIDYLRKDFIEVYNKIKAEGKPIQNNKQYFLGEFYSGVPLSPTKRQQSRSALEDIEEEGNVHQAIPSAQEQQHMNDNNSQVLHAAHAGQALSNTRREFEW